MNKKGIASTTAIYSFFVVFILLLIASIMVFSNKNFLQGKVETPEPLTDDYKICNSGDNLSDCLFKFEYMKNKNKLEYEDNYLANVTSYTINNIKSSIEGRGTPKTIEDGALEYEGMYASEDNYGTSYYYRGGGNNYVSYAGFLWRIVRVNGDDSIRLILAEDGIGSDSHTIDEVVNKTLQEENATHLLNGIVNVDKWEDWGLAATFYKYEEGNLNSPFNYIAAFENGFSNDFTKLGAQTYNKTYCVGAMYNDAEEEKNFWKSLGISLETAFKYKDVMYNNKNNSSIMKTVNRFYSNYISSFSDYLSLGTTFCMDKSVSTSNSSKLDDVYQNACSSTWENSSVPKIGTRACTNSVLNGLKNNTIVYEGLNRLLDNSYSLGCSTSCNNAGSVLHQIVNYSLYSYSNNNVIYQYNISNLADTACFKESCTTKCRKTGWLGIEYKGSCDNQGECKKNGGDWKVDETLVANIGDCKKLSQAVSNNQFASYADNKLVGNGALTYPIGLISMDEAILSGVSSNSKSEGKDVTSSISSRELDNYWTSTVLYTDKSESIFNALHIQPLFAEGYGFSNQADMAASYYYVVDKNNTSKISNNFYLNSNYDLLYARPVINLKSNIKYSSGSGTIRDPYEIEVD